MSQYVHPVAPSNAVMQMLFASCNLHAPTPFLKLIMCYHFAYDHFTTSNNTVFSSMSTQASDSIATRRPCTAPITLFFNIQASSISMIQHAPLTALSLIPRIIAFIAIVLRLRRAYSRWILAEIDGFGKIWKIFQMDAVCQAFRCC